MRSDTTSPGAEVWLDDLDLQDAVMGDGLMLLPGPRLTLYTVAHGRARLLGTFDDAIEAWSALDGLTATS
jgi:hypothetical protein